MLKAICTRYCQARKSGSIIFCQIGRIYTFNDGDELPPTCFRVLEKTEEAPAVEDPAPVKKKAVKKTVRKKTVKRA